MPLLHQHAPAIKQRIESLTPGSTRVWGQMSPDQMLWHVNQALEMAIGTYRSSAPVKVPLPRWAMKLVLLKLPWPKGAPTGPDFVARQSYDFGEQQAKALQLVDALVARPIDGPWPENPVVGPLSGEQWSHLMHKHLDHHLRQFSC